MLVKMVRLAVDEREVTRKAILVVFCTTTISFYEQTSHPGKLQSGDTDLERFLVYLCIGVKLLILDTLSTYTYEIDLKNLHLNTPFLLVLNNSMRGGVNNFMPFRKQRLSKCCIFGDIFSKYMNLSIFVLRLI